MKLLRVFFAVGALACASPAGAQVNGPGGGSSTLTYDSGPVALSSPTTANSSHAAGVSVGGLFALPIARLPGGGGIITNFIVKSFGGFTGGYTTRVWSRNPANTTCADNSNFIGSNADDAFLVTAPFTLLPSAPGSTTGDATTYAGQQNVSWDYTAAPGSQNIYVCLVANATDTQDQNNVVRVTVSGPQN